MAIAKEILCHGTYNAIISQKFMPSWIDISICVCMLKTIVLRKTHFPIYISIIFTVDPIESNNWKVDPTIISRINTVTNKNDIIV